MDRTSTNMTSIHAMALGLKFGQKSKKKEEEARKRNEITIQ